MFENAPLARLPSSRRVIFGVIAASSFLIIYFRVVGNSLNMSEKLAVEKPSHITGGCLCGAVRYQMVFPKESDWPPGVCLLFIISRACERFHFCDYHHTTV